MRSIVRFLKSLLVPLLLAGLSGAAVAQTSPCACDSMEVTLKIRRPDGNTNLIEANMKLNGKSTGLGGSITVKLRRGQIYVVNFFGKYSKGELDSCPGSGVLLEVPCGVETWREGFPTGNWGGGDRTVGFSKLYGEDAPTGPGHVTSEDTSVCLLRIPPLQKLPGGSNAPTANPNNPGAPAGGGGSVPLDQFIETGTGLMVQQSNAAVSNSIPLGFATSDGKLVDAGYLTFAETLPVSSLTVADFRIDSFFHNASDPTNSANDPEIKVSWAATPAPTDSSRIVIAEEAVAKLANSTYGVLVQVYAPSAYTAPNTFTGSPISEYLLESLDGGDKVRIKQWINGAATAAEKEFELDGDTLTETADDTKVVTIVEQNHTALSSVPSLTVSNDAAIRSTFRRVTRKTYQVTGTTEILISMTVEEYKYIPEYRVTGVSGGAPVFGTLASDLLRIHEVLVSRRQDLDGAVGTSANEPTETWEYYGQGTGLGANAYLTNAGYYLLGRTKLEVSATGNWILYGYDRGGNTVVTYEPWKDTLPPSLGVSIVDDETDAGLPVRKTTYEYLFADETLTTIRTTFLLEEKEEGGVTTTTSNVIGEEVTNSTPGSESGWVDYEGLAASFSEEISGSWPGAGDAWSAFNTSGPATHKMRITTRGTSINTGSDFHDWHMLYLLPERSTQEIVISDDNGPVLRETRVLPAGATGIINESHFVAMTRETYAYDAQGRQTQVKRDGRVVLTTSYPSATETVTTDEQGIITTTMVDNQGRVISQTTGAGGGVGAIVRTTEYNGLETRQKVNGVLVSRTEVDLAGRVTESEDQIGAVTYTSYSNGGRTTTETLPGNVGIVSANHRDGRPASVTGSGTVERYYEYSTEADPDDGTKFNQLTTERLGVSTSLRRTVTVYHWSDGRQIQTRVPDASSLAYTVVATTGHEDLPSEGGYQFQGVGTTNTGYTGTGSAASASYPANDAAGAMGMHTISGKVQGWGTTRPTGASRVTESELLYVLYEGKWWEKSIQTTGVEEIHATRHAYTMNRMWEGDGRKSIARSEDGELVTTNTVFNIANQESTITAVSTRSANPTISYGINGYVQWTQDGNSSAAGNRASFTYDGFGRQVFARDHRGGTTRRVYNTFGQVEQMIDTLGRVTAYEYVAANAIAAGQVKKITKPDNATTIYTYTARGEVATISGTAEYPQVFTYNIYGDRESLRTTQALSNVFTVWSYNVVGLVSAKYHGLPSAAVPGTAPNGTEQYLYDPFGRLITKTVVGGKITKYGYNLFGEMTGIDYNGNGDFEVTINRDDAGLVDNVAESFEDAAGNVLGSGTETHTYVAGRLDKVQYSSGHSYLPNVKLDYHALDATGRRAGYEVFDNTTSRLGVDYGYDTAGRLGTVGSDKHGTFTYDYHPGSGIMSGYSGNSGGAVVSQSRAVDFQNRISSVVTKNGAGQTLASVAYSYDNADRRHQARREDGGYWSYSYNPRGELLSGARYDNGNYKVDGLERVYQYDNIGNRRNAFFGGGATGALSQMGYEVNSSNQYSRITHPGKAWVVGQAPWFAPVVVNGSATVRWDTGVWFSKEVSAANTSGPLWTPVEVKDGATPPNTIASGHLSIPDNDVAPAYDEAGNLVNDGKWVYEWDSVNRLRKMSLTSTAQTAATTAGIPVRTIEFVYDWQGRRIAKKVTEGSTVTSDRRYLYEEWNVVAEWAVTGGSLPVPQTYLWGLDLGGQQSGNISQLQAAGGVGGLLAVNVIRPSAPATKIYAAYDGNGNILGWSDADGLVTQTQEYDPFGNVVLKKSLTGNPLAPGDGEVGYGFSTKPEDKETGLLYYGYRYYDPVTGRWPSRDPIEENGGVNLYCANLNNLIQYCDALGLKALETLYVDVEGNFGGAPHQAAIAALKDIAARGMVGGAKEMGGLILSCVKDGKRVAVYTPAITSLSSNSVNLNEEIKRYKNYGGFSIVGFYHTHPPLTKPVNPQIVRPGTTDMVWDEYNVNMHRILFFSVDDVKYARANEMKAAYMASHDGDIKMVNTDPSVKILSLQLRGGIVVHFNSAPTIGRWK